MTVSGHISDYASLYALIQRQIGIRLSDQHRFDLVPLIQQLMVSLQQNHPLNLVALLEQVPITCAEWQMLINAVTVGETYFFRYKDQFNVLRDQILPALINARRNSGHKHLSFWSAGCASGEEPYSLAILLREILDDINTWQIHILATDINMASLDHARRGWYRPWSFRNETPHKLELRWFQHSASGFQLDNSIRAMVMFAPLNLMAESYRVFENNITHADIILCRNVSMYMDAQTMQAVFVRLSQSLAQDGWLLSGHAEAPPSQVPGFVARSFKNTVIYQKVVDSAEATREIDTLMQSRLLIPINAMQVALPAETPSNQLNADNPIAAAEQAANAEQWDIAMIWLAKAEREDMLHPYVHYLRAVVQMQLADTPGALVSLRRAIYCDPNFALAHFMLGDCYQKGNDLSAAQRHWRRAHRTIRNLVEAEPLPYSAELTVEDLKNLIYHRLEGIKG
jgi:chemotaxis protein methyltransferase CheR